MFADHMRPAALVFALWLALALAVSCSARPTVTPVPTIDVVGTVTALAQPVAATQTALAASATQAAGTQGTAAAQSGAEAATATAAAQAQAAAGAAAATTQAGAAAQATQAQAAASEAATATALANALASQGATATALAAANATAFANSTALAAATLTPTRTPPTSTPTVLPPAACVPANSAFASIIGKAATAGLDIGCTTGAAFSMDQTAGALQEFWANAANPDAATHFRSLMIWRGDTRAIYVIRGQDTQASQGTLSTYNDTYQDGQPDVPAACATLKPPAGYQMPLRGFGKVWCDNKLDGTIGWPNRNEANATLLIQTTQRGLVMKVTAPSVGLSYLVALDLATKRAVTAQP